MEKPKLLLIDDDQDVLDSYKAYLEPHFDIDTSTEVAEAIENLATKDYDVAIVDMHFGVDDPEGGLRIIEYAVEEKILTEMIILTAHGDAENATRALTKGAFSYIVKGSDREKEKLVSTAIKAVKENRITIVLSQENASIVTNMARELKVEDSITVFREGLRLLRWAIGEWANGKEIYSRKGNRIWKYPNLTEGDRYAK